MDKKTKQIAISSAAVTALGLIFLPTVTTIVAVSGLGYAAWKTWGHKLTKR